MAARFDELEKIRPRGAPTKAPVAEALGKIGRQPIFATLVGVNKGDDRGPEYTSRLVVREAKRSKVDEYPWRRWKKRRRSSLWS